MWITTFHRFEDRSEFLAACAAAGWGADAEGLVLPAGVVVDEVGKWIGPASIGPDGMPIAGVLLDRRHHVNLAWHARDMDPAFAASQVFPADPARAYALPPPPAAEPAVPALVAAWKAKRVLANHGLLDAVEAAVAAAGGLVADAWAGATEWRRDSEFLAALAGVIGLDAGEIDDLFREADAIRS